VSRRPTRSDDWGFPRWRTYGKEREAVKVRMCDQQGCGKPGDFPAPKAPNSDAKWWFCAEHVAEYNKGWDYFAGLTAEEAQARAAEEARNAAGFKSSGHWEWSQAGEDGLTPAERSAFRALDLDPTASSDEIKKRYRELAKMFHPDVNIGDAAALVKFQAVQSAYDALKARL
jgi:DnaJ domain